MRDSATERREAGFTLIEVAAAALIFLIAFTGIMSLMMVSLRVGNQARERTAMTNAANSYIENVRRLPYFQIGLPSEDPTGTLVETTATVDGIVMHVVPVVTWLDDPTIPGTTNYKKLTVTITAWPQGVGKGSPLTFVAEAIIKETDSGTNLAAILPTIDFTGSSPASNSVVSGPDVTVGAIASANGDGVTLTSMNFYCDQVRLVDIYDSTSQWSLSAASDTRTFRWNSAAVDASTGAPVWADGWRTLRVEVWDSNGKQSFVDRQILIDNSPPGTPSYITTDVPWTATQMGLTWGVSMDGTNPAYKYVLSGSRQATDGWGDPGVLGSWLAPVSYETSDTRLVFPGLRPYSRYRFWVQAFGPPLLYKPSGIAETIAVTRPLLTGTWKSTWNGRNGSNRSVTTSFTINLTPPSFPTSSMGTVNKLYHWTRADKSDIELVASGSGWSATQTFVVGGNTNVVTHYFQASSELTPLGYKGGTPLPPLWSEVIGPNGTADTASGNMPHGAW